MKLNHCNFNLFYKILVYEYNCVHATIYKNMSIKKENKKEKKKRDDIC